ncbi:MAG: hypothetical protein QM784_13905 [Polyangiaceae bacterium]
MSQAPIAVVLGTRASDSYAADLVFLTAIVARAVVVDLAGLTQAAFRLTPDARIAPLCRRAAAHLASGWACYVTRHGHPVYAGRAVLVWAALQAAPRPIAKDAAQETRATTIVVRIASFSADGSAVHGLGIDP